MHKILVVDDEAYISTQLEERLTSMGYEVIGRASSGEEAVEMAKSLMPELVLMDIVMPGRLDGIDASEKIKEDLDIPIIFLTAYADQKFVDKAKIVEPFGYIVKPFQEREIKATIEVALHKKDIERRLLKSEEVLRNTRDYLDSLFNYANAPIIVWDAERRITRFNHAFEHMTSLLADEVIGQELSILFPESSRDDSLGKIQDTLGGEYWESVEIPILRKDGYARTALWNSANVYAEDGVTVIATIAQGQDITERKQAEEKIKASLKEKEVLLSEIYHRVKNNMQAIISLLRLQADKIEDKKYADIFKESENRIRSMALIHEQLYQSKDFANINFGNYVKSLIHALFKSHGVDTNKIRLTMDIKDIPFDLENAIPCGLIINELVSNSLKHAFPQKKEGHISISLQPISQDELELTVSDNGVGIPEELDIRNTGTMGLSLVRMLAEDQLNGKITLKRTQGTQFHIKIKRAAYKLGI